MIQKRTVGIVGTGNVGVAAAYAIFLLEDQKSVLTVSRMLTGEYGLKDDCLSIPSVVGIAGVEDAILLRLDAAELKGLQRSAAFLKDNISGLSF